MSYADNLGDLRRAYDAKVDERSSGHDSDWKHHERVAFLDRMRAEGRKSMLEVGAGTGVHGRWFADHGIDVVCTDLSPAMVEHCRSLGLVAHVRDFLSIDLGPFDACFAMNCLLHVPRADLDAVLRSISACLRPGGLFFWGQYGGEPFEGTRADDHYEPKRWFVSLTDDEITAYASAVFEVIDVRAVDVGYDDGHFQALTLRS